jgi:thiamine pyrophosphokinase
LSDPKSGLRALVVGDGEVDDLALRAALESSEPGLLVVAADGGARHLAAVGRLPDLICGDGDSLGDELRTFEAQGVRVELYPADKDQSDLELAIDAAIRAGAGDVDVYGALAGPRPEHAVANELLLASSILDGVGVVVHHLGSRFRRIGTRTAPGSAHLRGNEGDYVSLLALDDPVRGVVTEGLRFPLRSEPLALGSTRGLSNELCAATASIATSTGRLLVVETPRSPAIQGAPE